jgi:transcriptional regulator with XRE-family HTH domain
MAIMRASKTPTTPLGQRLRDLRLGINWTQQEVADRLKISRGTVSNAEAGKNIPDLATLVKLASFYTVELHELTALAAVDHEVSA